VDPLLRLFRCLQPVRLRTLIELQAVRKRAALDVFR
jgi:hypothetical protein